MKNRDTLTPEMWGKLWHLHEAISANLPGARLPEEVVDWYLTHKDEIPDALRRGFVTPPVQLPVQSTEEKPTEKFDLLADLGIIVVPKDYNHKTALRVFGDKNRGKFYKYNSTIDVADFSNPSRILEPGDELQVCVFKQVVPGKTTSEERMAFLSTQKAVYPGAQGIFLVFEQKNYLLPRGYLYTSFDERDRLWEDPDGQLRVLSLCVHRVGSLELCLNNLDCAWVFDSAFFCFREVS